MFSSAWNEPSDCLWYDEWPTKLHNENVRSLATCDMQLSSSIYYILVTSVYEPKQPVWWSLVHQMDHVAVCGMMEGPLSFLLRILYYWKAVICSIPTVYMLYLQCQYISQSSPSAADLWCYDWGLGLSELATYWLWLLYKVCRNVLVMDSSISQHWVSHAQ